MDGDKIELEIEGLGRLAFNVKDDLKRTWGARDAAADAREGGAEDAGRLPGHHAAIDRETRARSALISARALTRCGADPHPRRHRLSPPRADAGERQVVWARRKDERP